MRFISVIIPNYNHGKYLERRIESVVNQTYNNFELIILDDCSGDNSRQIIEEYRSHPKVSYIGYNQKNSGSSFKQWLRGIALAKGEWIWIAESDDEARPEFLEKADRALSEYPSAGIFYCNSVYENLLPGAGLPETTAMFCNNLFHTVRWDSDYFNSGKNEISDYLCKYNCIVNASSVVFNKRMLEPVLKTIDSVTFFGDWISYIQIASRADIVYSSLLLNKYRRHCDSALNKNIQKWKRKKEHFIVYNCLYKISFLKSKKELERFHIINYLDLGSISDRFSDNLKTVLSYLRINFRLALKVLAKIFLMKLTKHR